MARKCHHHSDPDQQGWHEGEENYLLTQKTKLTVISEEIPYWPESLAKMLRRSGLCAFSSGVASSLRTVRWHALHGRMYYKTYRILVRSTVSPAGVTRAFHSRGEGANGQKLQWTCWGGNTREQRKLNLWRFLRLLQEGSPSRLISFPLGSASPTVAKRLSTCFIVI